MKLYSHRRGRIYIGIAPSRIDGDLLFFGGWQGYVTHLMLKPYDVHLIRASASAASAQQQIVYYGTCLPPIFDVGNGGCHFLRQA